MYKCIFIYNKLTSSTIVFRADLVSLLRSNKYSLTSLTLFTHSLGVKSSALFFQPISRQSSQNMFIRDKPVRRRLNPISIYASASYPVLARSSNPFPPFDEKMKCFIFTLKDCSYEVIWKKNYGVTIKLMLLEKKLKK